MIKKRKDARIGFEPTRVKKSSNHQQHMSPMINFYHFKNTRDYNIPLVICQVSIQSGQLFWVFIDAFFDQFVFKI